MLSTVIVCVIMIGVISIVAEIRVSRIERVHKNFVEKAKKHNREMHDVAQESLSYLDATWSLLIDRMEEGEDIELLIEEKRTELMMGEMENAKQV